MGEVRTLTRRTDAVRMAAAASAAYAAGDEDVADLLGAVSTAMTSVGDLPLSEVEMFRWSGVVGHARRIAKRYVA